MTAWVVFVLGPAFLGVVLLLGGMLSSSRSASRFSTLPSSALVSTSPSDSSSPVDSAANLCLLLNHILLPPQQPENESLHKRLVKVQLNIQHKTMTSYLFSHCAHSCSDRFATQLLMHCSSWWKCWRDDLCSTGRERRGCRPYRSCLGWYAPGFNVPSEVCFQFCPPLWTASRHVGFMQESGETDECPFKWELVCVPCVTRWLLVLFNLADSLFLADSTINSSICEDSLICESVLFLRGK
jgi:hypothetical protein